MSDLRSALSLLSNLRIQDSDVVVISEVKSILRATLAQEEDNTPAAPSYDAEALRSALETALWDNEYPAKPGSVRIGTHNAWVKRTAASLLPVVAAALTPKKLASEGEG